jgi:hypothetical protein
MIRHWQDGSTAAASARSRATVAGTGPSRPSWAGSADSPASERHGTPSFGLPLSNSLIA